MAEVETSVRGNSHGLDSSDDSNGSSPLPTSVKNSPSDADKLFTHLSSKSYMHNESNDSDLNGNGITQGDPAVSNILFNPVRDGDDDFVAAPQDPGAMDEYYVTPDSLYSNGAQSDG